MTEPHTLPASTLGAAVRKGLGMVYPAALPLVSGLAVFAAYMWLSSRQSGLSANDIVLVASSPFAGIDLVYGMLFASLFTVGIATWAYLGELETMMIRAAKVGSAGKIRAASRILRFALLLDALLFVSALLIKGNFDVQNSCSFRMLLTQAKSHDLAVGVIFLAFIVADWLTFLGLREAMSQFEPASDECRHARLDSDFALQQLWLVDVPVLVGAIISVLAVYFAAGANHWDSNLLHLAPQIESFMERGRITAVLTCDNRPLSLPEFQESVARIFTAGIAMGYLAAHVLMSQFVFIALTIFHRRRRDQPAAGQ